MKKILLWCFLILGLGVNAQIFVDESFEGTSLPGGWGSFSNAGLTTAVTPSYGTSAGTACVGAKEVYRNLYSFSTEWYMVYSSTISNGSDLTYSLKYLAKSYNSASTISGTIGVDYSVDGGATWTDLVPTFTISGTSQTPIPCTTLSGTIPGASIPTAANFKFRIKSVYTNPGDYYIGFDDIKLTQTINSIPACTTVTTPANASTGVSRNPTITYAQSGGSTSYLINLGTTPGGKEILNSYNNGANNSYALPTANTLLYNTTYYLQIIPSNSFGSATGCAETTFTTLNTPCPSVGSPALGATNISLKPTIAWSSVSGVTGYKISVGTTAGGTDVVNNQDLGNVLNFTFASNLNPSTTYYYTVYAYQGTNVSTGCTERTFTTGSTPPPANDDCSGAIPLTVNADLNCVNVTAGNTLAATLSMAAAPCAGNPDDDVWYSFVATSTAHSISLLNVTSTGSSTSTDAYFQVLSGSCGSLTSLLCNDPNSGTVSGLVVGQTYYIRVYTYSNGAFNISFNICVGTPPAAPSNDECANAIDLTVNPDLTCTAVTAGETSWATLSMAATPCFGNPDDDVWYSFVATNTSHVISLTNVVATVGTSTDAYFQVLSGSCGTMTSVQCSDPNSSIVNGLTVGQKYYIRVYTYTSGNSFISFNICVATTPPPPTNDNCTSPMALTAGATFNQNAVTATNAGATATTDPTAVHPCQTIGYNEVWFSVVVPPSGSITIETDAATGSSVSDTVLGVYSGSCGALTMVGCDDDAGNVNFSKVSLTGQTPGATLLVGVWNYSSSTYGDFKIAAYDGSLSTNETISSTKEIKLYPNPFSEVLNISDVKNVKSVTIMDVSGRLVKTITKPNAQLSLPELSKGMYVVTLHYADGSKKSMKMIKK